MNSSKSYAVPILATLSAIGFAVTVWLIFTYTPLAETLYFNQKIVYYHVPHAFMLFAAVAACGLCSLVFLKTRKPAWDDVALATAEVAVAFGAVVLITGSVWGKVAWGVWWSWEKRLTMSLLLWLVLVGYVLVRRFVARPRGRPGKERRREDDAIVGHKTYKPVIPAPYRWRDWASDADKGLTGEDMIKFVNNMKTVLLMGALMGLFLGFPAVFAGLFLGFVGGGLSAILLLVTRVRGRRDAVPYAPFLAAGAWIALLYGNQIVAWYAGRFV